LKTGLRFGLAAVTLAFAQAASAGFVNFAGALAATDPLYNRVLSGTPPTGLSAVGTAVRYDTFQFWVNTAGAYSMETLSANFTSGTSDDTFITLYLGSTFNAATPLVNALAADDDSGAGFLSLININLMANTNYLLVVTSFANGQLGNYTGQIRTNPITGNGIVTLGTVPVPAPATAALVPLALAALALTRRRRPAPVAA
jgi:MYXO-CTERM domain-containing protein